MRPALFRWRNITIWSYPAMLYCGLVLGVLAGNIAAHHAGINTARAYIATIILIIPALAGARLLFIAAHWDFYRRNLERIWNRREGGYVMYGGLCAVFVSFPLLRALRLNYGAFWDVSTFTILTGMVFTRIGCFLNGCCYGRRSESWCSANLPGAHGTWERRLPTQIFEAVSGAALLIFAAIVWRWMPFSGALFLSVTLFYSCLRFIMEFAREPGPRGRVFRIAHAISMLAFVSSASVLALWWPR